MNKKHINISIEATPNPQSMKFTVNHDIAEENWETSDITESQRSPLAQKIMGFPWATRVFIGRNFIAINKEDWVDWDIIIKPLSELIKEHIESNQVVLSPELPVKNNTIFEGRNQEIVKQIKLILKKEIQPAVAMDGGFISFADYKNGTVFLRLQGACSGCPSASITLKQGIEKCLKERIPEVQSVVDV